jgi:protein SCO1/2
MRAPTKLQRHADAGRRRLIALAVLAAAGALFGGCGSSKQSSPSTAAARVASAGFQSAGTLEPVQQAPPLSLRNYLGQRVNLSSYRGKAVLITFVYTHCPDVCPLMVSNLRVAQNLLGKAASKAEVIAVSVDPRGDDRKTVTRFLAQREMTGRMQYLVGSAHELAAVWKAWGIGAERDAKNPDLLEHSGLVYGITGTGKRLTIYAANFQPSAIAHDVPLLAAR